MDGDHDRGMAATKLRPPSSPRRLVQRPRLGDLLDEGVAESVPLLLVSAPAGSGKSTLVAAWALDAGRPVAWLQIEASDSDPASFWSSLVAAIGRCRPEVASVVGPLVIGAQGDGRVVVPAIINALVDVSDPLVVVIDDYHLIDDDGVHRGVERLVDLCPAQLTVVMCTRVDPPFRLGRMRVRKRLGEIRAEHLRFAPDEATALLGAAGDELSPERLDDLCSRTEGWAAGLVLAGLSLERAPDPGRFVDAFRGDDQLVVSYLSDELLDAMSAGDRQRLLETAVLEHLTGPLVDAVTGSADGTSWLADITNRNQLIIRLDSTGEWFRYHHLLRDLLLLEAQRTMPQRLAELHARAADWFASNGDRHQAVVHRFAAGDVPGAIAQMYFVGPDLLGRGQIRKLRGFLEQAGEAAANDVACALGWGWCEYLSSRHESARRWLDVALAVAPPSFDPVIAAPLRINLALGSGDVAAALQCARQATADGELWQRPAELATAVGAAYAWAGMHDDAHRALTIAITRCRAEQRLTAHVLTLIYVAIDVAEQGDRAASQAAAVDAVTTAESFGLAAYHGVAPAFAIRGRTAPEPGSARADVARALELARRGSTDLVLAYVLTTCGDTLLDLGDAAGAALVVEARGTIDRCADPGIAGAYLSRIESRHHLPSSSTDTARSTQVQLTDRELAVLRYLPTNLSQRDIAAALYVSLNTVKTHCNAIFRKLGTSDRKSAVQAARDRHLL
ncbi:MAG: putative LuxR family transcriptional regulator [Ilumatobacteraceae bacterium]|nr:putative LuxR family transcriptional regulator [Ilumatobacteraceae bacterium]MCU1387594.1 putative LuxR family transcriptional regulator [Ilumatobacteraceae bacterium]